MDEDIRKRKHENTVTFDDDDEGDDSDDWQKPTAYSKLLGILQKSSKHQDYYKRIKLEEEGLEDQEDGMDDDDEEEVDDEEEEEEGMYSSHTMSPICLCIQLTVHLSKVLELTAEEEKQLREKYGDDYLTALDQDGSADEDDIDGEDDDDAEGDQEDEEEEEAEEEAEVEDQEAYEGNLSDVDDSDNEEDGKHLRSCIDGMLHN